MNEQNNYIVYMHINKINDKKYIGITCQMPRKRWKNGYGYDVGCYFRNAIDKYGWNNFEHVVLFKNLSQKQAKEKEIELIKKYNTMNRNLGYNRTEGGDGCQGIIMSNETKQKLREFNLGKLLSDETKRKMSISRTGSKNCNSVKVCQYDLDGNFIRLWDCMMDASKELNINNRSISGACLGKINHAGGYRWTFENKEVSKKSVHLKRKVNQIDSNTNEIMATYNSLNKASVAIGISAKKIHKVCDGLINSVNGYKFEFVS